MNINENLKDEKVLLIANKDDNSKPKAVDMFTARKELFSMLLPDRKPTRFLKVERSLLYYRKRKTLFVFR